MGEDKVVRDKARKVAIIVGIAVLAGFSILLFMPTTYNNPFSGILISVVMVFFPIGALVAFIAAKIAYFLFKRIKNKLAFITTLVICVAAGVILGFSVLTVIFRGISRTKPYTNEIDTNGDGKIDKWIYHDDNNSATIVKIDTDYDGMPDIEEDYKGIKLIKRQSISGANKK